MKIVKISSPTCVPCKKLQPVYKQLKADYPNIEFVEYENMTDALDLVRKYHIKGVPAVLIFKTEESVPRMIVGNKPKEVYVEVIEELLN
jgi:thioredoxin 1